MDATAQMYKAVQNAEKALLTAQTRFDTESSSITTKASQSIDLFGGSATSQVAELVMDARRCCDALYAVCQTQIRLLDEACRPLLAKAPHASAVKEVWEMICRLNEDSEITNNFTASLNSHNLGDVATVQYSPSMECKMIESYWEAKYQSHPGRNQLEAEEKAERERLEKEEQEWADQQRKRDQEAYEQALQKWECTKKEMETKRSTAFCEALANREKEMRDELKHVLDANLEIQTNLKNRCAQEYAEAETALASLKFYQVLKKILLSKHIKELSMQITTAEQAIIAAKQKYEADIWQVKSKIDSQKSLLESQMKERYPIPRKPRKPVSLLGGNASHFVENAKEEILNALEKHGPLSFIQIQELHLSALEDFTLRRIASCCHSLASEGEITITQKRIDGIICNVCELVQQ
jgi:hypothetical protein